MTTLVLTARRFCRARLVLAAAVIATLLNPVPARAQQQSRTLLAVFAHPDDERIVGPLLARYGREGVHVVLVIATDGRKGVSKHAGIPAGDSLARLRAAEARCATAQLGIAPPRLLGLEDGGLASFAALTQLRDSLSTIMRELRPGAIITFGPEGGTGHPDHRLVGDVVTELVQRAAHGSPEQLYFPSLPSERMGDAPPARPTIATIAERYLTVRVSFERGDLESARRAFACHATQYTAEEMSAIMRYLAHGFAGYVHLRPWRASDAVANSLFR
jgi:LmbE family N-acetylglucosaminyl deacetylase